MVDYTTTRSSSAFGIFLGAAFVVVVMLYAIYAGGDAGTADTPAVLEQPATDGTATVLD